MDIEEAISKEFHAELIPEENLKEESFMKKNFKRIAAVVISLVTLLLLAIPAFAYNKESTKDRDLYWLKEIDIRTGEIIESDSYEIEDKYVGTGWFTENGKRLKGTTFMLNDYLNQCDGGEAISTIVNKKGKALYYVGCGGYYSIKEDDYWDWDYLGDLCYFITAKNSSSAKHIKLNKLKKNKTYYLWIKKKSTLGLQPMWSYTWYGKSKISFISKKETSKYTRYKFKTKRKGTLECELYDKDTEGEVFYDDFDIRIK